jgi:phage N-6-adenine-methyltransferase
MKYEMQKLMFSSQSGDWKTPQDLFDQLDKEFDFTLDVCVGVDDAPLKADMLRFHYHGLSNSWKVFDTRNVCYMNPPYGREITKWLYKAMIESLHNHVTVVALLPARTDTKWFWKYCAQREIRFIKGRLKFSNHQNSAPFPSMVVIFRP